MTNKKVTKRTLLASCLSIVLCIAMLIGTTFAWFSDSVVNTGNKIQAGTLNVSLWEKQTDGTYADISDSNTPLFSYTKWEPGYTAMKDLQLHTSGTLALRYQVVVKGLETLEPATTKDIQNVLDVTVNGVKIGTLADFVSGTAAIFTGTMIPDENKTSADLNVQIHMQEDAGNDYQGAVLPDFDVRVNAAQYPYETDGFGNNQYDASAVPKFDLTAKVNHTAGTDSKVIDETGLTVTVDQAQPTDFITAIVQTDSVTKADTLTTLDLTISVKNSKDEDVPAIIEYALGKNLTNVQVQHSGIAMAAGDYSYDVATGIVTIHCTSYSPYSITYLTPDQASKYWSYAGDVSWYTGHESDTAYVLNNANELAGLASLVNSGASFEGKTVTLGTDVDLAGKEWTPIGNEINPFIGSFDGAGHKISGLCIGSSKTYDNVQLSVGLFGQLGNTDTRNASVVHDLSVDGAIYTAHGQVVGILAGCSNVVVYNCNVTGTINHQSDEANCLYGLGGLIGQNLYSVTNCKANTNISVDSYACSTGNAGFAYGIGGLVGNNAFRNGISVVNSTANGSIHVSAKDSYPVGGLIGRQNVCSHSYLENCFADVSINVLLSEANKGDGQYVHAFGGYISTNGSSFVHCYFNQNAVVTVDGSQKTFETEDNGDDCRIYAVTSLAAATMNDYWTTDTLAGIAFGGELFQLTDIQIWTEGSNGFAQLSK